MAEQSLKVMGVADEGAGLEGVACSVRRTAKPHKGLGATTALRGLQDMEAAVLALRRRTGP